MQPQGRVGRDVAYSGGSRRYRRRRITRPVSSSLQLHIQRSPQTSVGTFSTASDMQQSLLTKTSLRAPVLPALAPLRHASAPILHK